MKLLHTGDWHLGKSLHETSLLEDQRHMLDFLRVCLSRDDYSVLLIAGDIYDRTIPPAEAVELFSDFLVRIRQDFPALSVCIIPGNHDSAQRLSYADRILGSQHIHIICNPEQTFNPIIITAHNGERLALFLLPFLAPGTLKSPDSEKTASAIQAESGEFDFSSEAIPILLSQADLAAEASRRFRTLLKSPELKVMPSILVAHLFTLAGTQSESERLFLGTAEQVSPSLFSDFSFVALGHLHRTQKVTDRMYYAGSPLAYAFDEAGNEKSFLKLDIDCTSPSFPVLVTSIPVVPFRNVVRLSGSFAEFYSGVSFDSHSPDYLEITLTDDSLIANPMNLLRPKFPFLLSLRQGPGADTDFSGTDPAGTDSALRNGKDALDEKRDPVSDFCRFEEMLYGAVDPEKKELFTALLAECSDAT